jgi:hypothetical protein
MTMKYPVNDIRGTRLHSADIFLNSKAKALMANMIGRTRPVVRPCDLGEFKLIGDSHVLLGLKATPAVRGLLDEVVGKDNYRVNGQEMVIGLPYHSLNKVISRLNLELKMTLRLPELGKETADIVYRGRGALRMDGRLDSFYVEEQENEAGVWQRTHELTGATHSEATGLVLLIEEFSL